MFDELKKSISAILYERTTSPLFGTLLFSWCIWNWRILYLTIFVSEEKIQGNKIDYILNNFWNWDHIVWFPLLSTVILLTIVPFISNGAYWLSMKFENWKIEKKKIIERAQILTFEQSISLREEVNLQQRKFETAFASKDLEIKQLKEILTDKDKEIEILRKGLEDMEKASKVFQEAKELHDKMPPINEEQEMYNRILQSSSLKRDFETAMDLMQNGSALAGNGVSSKFIALLESKNYIDNKGDGKYQFTEKGKKLQSEYINRIFG